MDQTKALDGLNQIAQRTNNDILLLVIVLLIPLILLAIPLYRMVSSTQEKRRQQEMDRESQILNVIKDNTAVNTGLKILLEVNNSKCITCKQEQFDRFEVIGNKVDHNSEQLAQVITRLDIIKN